MTEEGYNPSRSIRRLKNMQEEMKKEIVNVEMPIEQWVRWAYRDIAVAYKYNDEYIAVIYHADDIFDPRDDENLWKFVFFHRSYDLGDYKWMKEQGIKLPDDFDEYYEEHRDEIIMKTTIYAYDHDKIQISLDNSTYPFNDRWEAGIIGYAIVFKNDIKKFYGDKEIMLYKLTDELKNKLWEELQHEIKVYNHYLAGENFCYEIYDKNTLNNIDGCCGFYEGIYDAIKEIREFVDEEYKDLFDDMETF